MLGPVYIYQTSRENTFFTATEQMGKCDYTPNIQGIVNEWLNKLHIKSSKNTRTLWEEATEQSLFS